MDASALLHGHGVRLRAASAVDLQLLHAAWVLEATAGACPPESLESLSRVLEKTLHARLSSAERLEMARVKEAAKGEFAADKGGSYEVWERRPLLPSLLAYCSDARTFFALRATYSGAEAAFGAELLRAVQRRLDGIASAPAPLVRDAAAARAVDPLFLAEVGAKIQSPEGGGGRGAAAGGAGGGGGAAAAPVESPTSSFAAPAPAAAERGDGGDPIDEANSLVPVHLALMRSKGLVGRALPPNAPGVPPLDAAVTASLAFLWDFNAADVDTVCVLRHLLPEQREALATNMGLSKESASKMALIQRIVRDPAQTFVLSSLKAILKQRALKSASPVEQDAIVRLLWWLVCLRDKMPSASAVADYLVSKDPAEAASSAAFLARARALLASLASGTA